VLVVVVVVVVIVIVVVIIIIIIAISRFMADRILFGVKAVTRFHCVCLKISDTELAFYTASGKSS
jgi:hypothetical protein